MKEGVENKCAMLMKPLGNLKCFVRQFKELAATLAIWHYNTATLTWHSAGYSNLQPYNIYIAITGMLLSKS